MITAISPQDLKPLRKVLMENPSVRDMETLDHAKQCTVHLEADAVSPRNPAPMYIQVFRDGNPADATQKWIYINATLSDCSHDYSELISIAYRTN